MGFGARGAELPQQTWAPGPSRVTPTPRWGGNTLARSPRARAWSLKGTNKPQTCSVFPAQARVSEQQTQCGFGLICREIFTPPFALFLASPSACQHGTFAGAAAHLLAVVGFFKHFLLSSFLLFPPPHMQPPLLLLCPPSWAPLLFCALIAGAARLQLSGTGEDGEMLRRCQCRCRCQLGFDFPNPQQVQLHQESSSQPGTHVSKPHVSLQGWGCQSRGGGEGSRHVASSFCVG